MKQFIVNRQNLIAIIVMIIAISILSLTFYKAATASFTHDESFTYNYYAHAKVPTLLFLANNTTANNHIFNTILLRLSEILFGTSELALRLPNILAHATFMFFSFLIVSRFVKKKLLVIPFFLIVNLNPFLLDFFALARGYGLSVMFVTASIYYFFTFTESNRQKDYQLSLFLALLATYSSFSALYYFISIILVYNIYLIPQYYKGNKISINALISNNKNTIIYTLILLALIAVPIYLLNKKDQLYFGGDTGFWHDTITTLAISTLYGNSYFEYGINTIKTIVVLLFLMGIVNLFISIIGKDFKNKFTTLTLIIFLIVITISAQHYLLDSKFIIERTATFLIPIFSLSFCFLLYWLLDYKYIKHLSIIIIFVAAGFSIFHTASNYSLTKYNDWQYDAHNKAMLQELKLDIEKNHINSLNIKLGIHWLFEPSINFYRKTRKLDWLNQVNRDGIKGDEDYFYIFEEDLAKEKIAKYTIIKRFENTGTILVRNEQSK